MPLTFSTCTLTSARLGAVLLILGLGTACSEQTPGTAPPGLNGSSSTSIAEVSGGRSSLRSITVNGVKRDFFLYVPGGLPSNRPVPLVLDFHGIIQSASHQMSISGYRAIAEREGFLVAYPGLDSAWNIGPCCTRDRNVDDVAFARAIVTAVGSEATVDSDRIYATGFSMGGGMAHYLACHAADLFAAVAPSAFDLLEENVTTCAPARPIPVLLTRGTNDLSIPYQGGASRPPNGLDTTIHFLGAEKTVAQWAQFNSCAQATLVDTHGCSIHTTCADGVQVGLCTVQGGGHSPGAAAVGWQFLSRHRLPERERD